MPRAAHQREARFNGQRSGEHPTIVDSVCLALRAARAEPDARVIAFLDDWSAIDDLRAAARVLGLEARLSAHHADARPFLPRCDLTPAARR